MNEQQTTAQVKDFTVAVPVYVTLTVKCTEEDVQQMTVPQLFKDANLGLPVITVGNGSTSIAWQDTELQWDVDEAKVDYYITAK